MLYITQLSGSLQVIAQLLSGDQVSVIADGFLYNDHSEPSYYMADGYTSLTGVLIRAGLE